MEGLFLHKYYYRVFNLELSQLCIRSRFYFVLLVIKTGIKSVCATINDMNLGDNGNDNVSFLFFLFSETKLLINVCL